MPKRTAKPSQSSSSHEKTSMGVTLAVVLHVNSILRAVCMKAHVEVSCSEEDDFQLDEYDPKGRQG